MRKTDPYDDTINKKTVNFWKNGKWVEQPSAQSLPKKEDKRSPTQALRLTKAMDSMRLPRYEDKRSERSDKEKSPSSHMRWLDESAKFAESTDAVAVLKSGDDVDYSSSALIEHNDDPDSTFSDIRISQSAENVSSMFASEQQRRRTMLRKTGEALDEMKLCSVDDMNMNHSLKNILNDEDDKNKKTRMTESTLFRIGTENDEMLEEMYRKELDEYYTSQAIKRGRASRKRCFKRCLASILTVAIIVPIVIVVLVVTKTGTMAELFTRLKTRLANLNVYANEEEPKIVLSKNKQIGCTGQEPNKEKQDIKKIIDEACNEEKLDVPQNLLKCQFSCASKMCCFTKSIQNKGDCSPHNNGECDDFLSCNILSSTNDNESELIATMCSMSKILSNEGFGACQKLCLKRACCFLPPKYSNCYSSATTWCKEYEYCENLNNIEPHSNSSIM